MTSLLKLTLLTQHNRLVTLSYNICCYSNRYRHSLFPLLSTGIVPQLIQDLWEIVEGGGDGGGGGGGGGGGEGVRCEGVRGEGWRDARLIAPWTHPLDHTHHLLHKVIKTYG